ncbi:MAG: hypothetical protein AAB675_01625 [Patescibacteria group bacterium]
MKIKLLSNTYKTKIVIACGVLIMTIGAIVFSQYLLLNKSTSVKKESNVKGVKTTLVSPTLSSSPTIKSTIITNNNKPVVSSPTPTKSTTFQIQPTIQQPQKNKVAVTVKYNNGTYYCYEDGANTVTNLDAQIETTQGLFKICSDAVNFTARTCDDTCKLQYNCDNLYLTEQWDECMVIQDEYKACLDTCSVKFNASLNNCVSAYSSQSYIAQLNVALSQYCP